MGKLHDDLKARTAQLLETAQKAVAVGTETQQQMTDIYQQLDEANKLLQQFIQDNAATGSSTGGSEQFNRSAELQPKPNAAEQGWKA